MTVFKVISLLFELSKRGPSKSSEKGLKKMANFQIFY